MIIQKTSTKAMLDFHQVTGFRRKRMLSFGFTLHSTTLERAWWKYGEGMTSVAKRSPDDDANLACQQKHTIEKGHDATIGCNSTEIPTHVFWYIGSPSSTRPILLLQDNQKSGTMYGDSRFDINSKGDMLIYNAQIEDEAKYTVVVYFPGGKFEQKQITVEITVSPQQQCPEIAGCSSCLSCSLHINQTGELQCTVNGSRPEMLLQWEINRIAYLQFTPRESISKTNDVLGTWDTYISAKYKLSSCGGFADIRCLARHNGNLKQFVSSNIRLTADPCTEEAPDDDDSATALPPFSDTPQPFAIGLSVMVIIAIILSVLVFIIIICCFRKRTKNKKREKFGTRLESQDDAIITDEQVVPDEEDSKILNRLKKKRVLNRNNEKLQCLVSFLCESYKKHLFIKLFPGENVSVDIDTLFVGGQCSVKWKNKEKSQTTTTDQLMMNENLLKEKWVTLTAGLGFGKTTFLLKMLNQWIKQKDKTFVLIYIHLNNANYQMSLADIILKEMPKRYNLDHEDVNKIMLNEHVIVLLDGLSELYLLKDCKNVSTFYRDLLVSKFAVPEPKATQSNNFNEANISSDHPQEGLAKLQRIDGIGNEQFQSIAFPNQKMRLWVALRERDVLFFQCYVDIELSEFNMMQLENLERKMYHYHLECKSTNRETDDHIVTEKSVLHKNPDAFKYDNAGQLSTTILTKEKYLFESSAVSDTADFSAVNIVREKINIIQLNYIIEDFPNVPLFLSTLLYLDIFRDTEYNMQPTKHWNSSRIVNTLIHCLEGHYITKLHDYSENISYSNVRRKIGKLLFDRLGNIFPKYVKDWEKLLDKDNLKTGLSIGLLDITSCSSKESTNSTNVCVTFRYPVLKGYLLAMYLLEMWSTNNDAFRKLFTDVKLVKNDEFKHALMYVCGTGDDEDSKKIVLTKLQRKGMWNGFINCFYEVQNRQTKETIVHGLQVKEEITLQKLHSEYHQQRCEDFITVCKKLNYPRGTLLFEDDFKVSFLILLPLPPIERVVISRRKMEEVEVINIVRWIAKSVSIKSLQFHNCAMNTFSPEALQKLTIVLQRLSTFHIEISTGHSWKKIDTKRSYDYHSGSWEETKTTH